MAKVVKINKFKTIEILVSMVLNLPIASASNEKICIRSYIDKQVIVPSKIVVNDINNIIAVRSYVDKQIVIPSRITLSETNIIAVRSYIDKQITILSKLKRY